MSFDIIFFIRLTCLLSIPLFLSICLLIQVTVCATFCDCSVFEIIQMAYVCVIRQMSQSGLKKKNSAGSVFFSLMLVSLGQIHGGQPCALLFAFVLYWIISQGGIKAGYFQKECCRKLASLWFSKQKANGIFQAAAHDYSHYQSLS